MNRLLILLPVLFVSVLSKTAEEWRTRSIYQILTDRFARHDGLTPECTDLLDYCGGTFKGIENNLDYIQGMGFDAIWISPVIKNGPKGYHGYWSSNLYEINSHFGTKQDFLDLIKACHDRDIWIMVDTVPNHVAPVDNDGQDHDFSEIVPFNDRKYFHWPILPCAQIFKNDPYNQTALEICWLWKLPDLRHEDPYVANTLLEWIKDFVQTYPIDGLRIDAVRHVPLWFWDKFCEASGVFTVGEVWFSEVKYVAQYQAHMDSLLNFPLFEVLQQSIRQGKSMTLLSKYYEEALAEWKDITVLGNFAGNHDLSRFLNETQDRSIFKSFYAFILTSVGIPMVYYGDEQELTGGIDPANREPLWGMMNTESDMYQYIKTILKYKKESQYHNYEQIERFADDNVYAFTRGETFFAFTNSEEPLTRIITSHPYSEGTYLCNIFNEKECIEIRDGEFQLTMLAKQVQIYTPRQNSESDSLGQKAWKNIKQVWSNIFAADPSKMDSLSRPDLKR